MKTKFYTLLAGIVFSAGTAFACDDSLAVKKCCFETNDEFKFWQGIDLGVNGYYNSSNNSLETPAGYDFLELDYSRSHSFALNLAQYNLHIYKNYVNLVTGIGFEWNSYSLRNNVSLVPDAPMISGINEPLNFSKNKLKTTWVNAPLLIEFNTSKVEERSFHIGLGATFGYNIFRNKLKQEFGLNGEEHKRVTKDDYSINPFRYSATARVGYGDYTIFANYGLSSLFKEGRGPKVYPFSAGVSLNF